MKSRGMKASCQKRESRLVLPVACNYVCTSLRPRGFSVGCASFLSAATTARPCTMYRYHIHVYEYTYTPPLFPFPFAPLSFSLKQPHHILVQLEILYSDVFYFNLSIYFMYIHLVYNPPHLYIYIHTRLIVISSMHATFTLLYIHTF